VKKVVLSLLALGFVGKFATAQNRSTSPDEVARAFFKAETDGRWLDAARLLDLSLFEVYLRDYTKQSGPERAFSLTPEMLQNADPDMPRAVAEYQVKRAREGFKKYDPIPNEFARVASRDSLAALSTEEAAARWLEAKDPRWKTEIALKEATVRCKTPMPTFVDQPPEPEILTPATAQLGSSQGAADTLRFLLFRSPQRWDPDVSTETINSTRMILSPSVLTLVRRGGEWRIIPSQDLGPGGIGTVFVHIECPIRSEKNNTPEKK
jgi:hypothetical protein